MKSKKLHEVIIEILESTGKPLTVRQITEKISAKNLWVRPSDKKSPQVSQVSARVNNYSKYFTRKNGVVTLNGNKESDNRLCKIVWNSNYWIKPMERTWNPAYIEDPNKGYEQKHGFVHEDWLFNAKFIFDGYQYGYIRGIGKLNPSVKFVETVFLFTINPNSKERFYVGKLHHVERLQQDEINKSILRKIKSYEAEMVGELKETGADYSELKRDPFIPNVRFKIETKELFQTPLAIESSWFDAKYFRTTPMKMNEKLYRLLDDLERQMAFGFVPSSPENRVDGYVKHTQEGRTEVSKVHNEIEIALYNFLLRQGVKRSRIACDTTSFGGKLADIVVKVGDSTYDIYEIKTDTDIRRGLREAIGQLLDYATWEKGVIVRNIYAILLYNPLSDNLKSFVDRLKKNIRLNFEILFYNRATKAFLQ